ncbi:hypothetical protein TSIB_1848 [Thermococcus sibiricus MM 739]|uniref:Uncharacterized protein n=1 Tax=Thermococcus sibiricus (strain DSM 12597 / MM 739) TaxID=604354 RepID=C5ZZR6_THESM|nr:hypothetical protein TSIB_1848 [Thermococcus sibiricus MM 739]
MEYLKPSPKISPFGKDLTNNKKIKIKEKSLLLQWNKFIMTFIFNLHLWYNDTPL